MHIGPKYKIARRLGSDVFEKTQTQKYQLNEDRRSKGRGRRRKPRSDYGKQLLEKQKTRFTYGIAERQFSKYVREAISQNKLKPPQALRLFLESRLDNVVYKMGLVSTRRAARQTVSHGHINVNGKRVKVPSYRVKDGDVISVRDRSKEKVNLQKTEEDKSASAVPVWISYDPKKQEGKVKSLPETGSAEDVNLDLTSVIEFYSR